MEINNKCAKLALWFSVSCLVLNVSKFNCVHFSLKQQVITYPLVYLDNNTIKRVDSTKSIGCFIDSKLNWHKPTHIEDVALKMCKGIAIVRVVCRLMFLRLLYV